MALPIYATRTDLDDFSVNTEALIGIAEGQIDRALSAASRVIDGYLKAQFTLPLVQWGDDIIQACCAIAFYWLMVRRGYNPEASVDKAIRQLYEDAIAWLKDIADGGGPQPDVTDSSAGSAEGESTVGGPDVVASSQRGWSTRGTVSTPGDFQGD